MQGRRLLILMAFSLLGACQSPAPLNEFSPPVITHEARPVEEALAIKAGPPAEESAPLAFKKSHATNAGALSVSKAQLNVKPVIKKVNLNSGVPKKIILKSAVKGPEIDKLGKAPAAPVLPAEFVVTEGEAYKYEFYRCGPIIFNLLYLENHLLLYMNTQIYRLDRNVQAARERYEGFNMAVERLAGGVVLSMSGHKYPFCAHL